MRLRALLLRHWPAILALAAIAILVLLPPEPSRPAGEVPPVEAFRARVLEVRAWDDGTGTSVDPAADPAELDGDIRVVLLEGPDAGTERWAWLALPDTEAAPSDFAPGDEVVVTVARMPDGPAFVGVSERWRLPALEILLGAFLVLVVLVGRGHGVRALIGLTLGALLVLRVVIPAILGGAPPVPVALGVASLVAVASIVLTEGTGRTSAAALAGTLMALAVTGLLSALVGVAAAFSTAGTEDLVFLRTAAGAIDVRGLLLAAFILGALGVLDDVTVTQAATVAELATPDGPRGRALWAAAMRVGRAHIGATVNTLFLAYVGASLPLLVLFAVSDLPAALVVNRELVAIEVARTLVGSIGIVLAVPCTTAIAVVLADRAARAPGAATARGSD
ncbi:MAG: YibE/F family protein [Chloroflexota bacterium]